MMRTASSPRELALSMVDRSLAGRQLVWLGIRGEDAAGLADYSALNAAFGITANYSDPLGRLAIATSLDELNGVRVDLDAANLDVVATRGYGEFRQTLLETLKTPSVLIPYRASDLSTSVALSERATVTLAGMLTAPVSRFEYKPWVELELGRWGVPVLQWDYVADEHRESVAKRAETEVLVLRPSADTGGEGIVIADSPSDVERLWPSREDELVAVSTFLEGATPLNFSGVVFPDGSCRLHPPSVQLIGVPECTVRRFGYCGNDFGAASRLDFAAHEQIDRMGRTVSAWLHAQGYVGAFGVDALFHEDRVWFTEINPRFQGSSTLSARIAAALDMPDLFTDHLLATLGLAPVGPDMSIPWWAANQPVVSHVVVHNTRREPVRIGDDAVEGLGDVSEILTQVPRGLVVDAGGTLGRLVLNETVTEIGDSLSEMADSMVRRLQTAARPTGSENRKRTPGWRRGPKFQARSARNSATA